MARWAITGITGQAGTVFSQKLLSEGHEVVGIYRRTANTSFGRLEESGLISHPNLTLVSGDLLDYSSLDRAVKEFRPDFIGNLAASSHVHESFHNPIANLQITGVGCANLLEVVRNNCSDEYRPKMWQMSSSEMFGGNYSDYVESDRVEFLEHSNVSEQDPSSTAFQNENTPLSANSPYAAAKIYAHNMCELYRRAYGLYVNSMICFNFESEFRGSTFVTKKVTEYVANLSKVRFNGKAERLKLGNLDSVRDWTYAGDMVDAVLLCLEQDAPDTYCVCSNQIHSIRDLCRVAFGTIGISNWEDFVEVDPKFIRPVEVPFLKGSNEKISKLGWKPKVSFEELISTMVKKDIQRIK